MIDRAVLKKRLKDNRHNLRDSPSEVYAGTDTTPEEDARLRQESPEDDEASLEAERTIGILREVMPHFWRLHDPDELAKLKQELREDALKESGQEPTRSLIEPEEEPFSSEKFWSDRGELERAAKKVRPPRL
ncbi:MAG: hypothetical protein ACLP3K_11605 [Candidatus Acidiferrales bacterium]